MKINHKIYTCDKTEGKLLTPALRALVKRAVKKALEYEGFSRVAEVSVTAVDPEEIKHLNAEWRANDSVTDVLSFPALDDEDEIVAFDDEAIVLGDIVLCTSRCAEQAEEFSHSIEREVAYLTAHSTLHLLGYDHMEADEEKEMVRRQGEITALLGL
jgi:probable rRNA maturation factor